MDTSSPFTWMQCEGCTKCFKQKPPPFPKNTSTSFHLVKDRNNNPSTFKLFYGDSSNASGIVARETLHLNSKNGDILRVLGYVFGCGLVNNMEYGKYKNNRIAGVMGLGWGNFSFVTKIKESKGRFSLCLPNLNMFTKDQRPKAYLRLGDDVLERRDEARSTKIMRVVGVGSYYVGLQGISINNKRLNISSSLFHGRNGGCIIDTGTPYLQIIEPAYLKLRQGLENYFSKDKNFNKTSASFGLDLCYVRIKPEGFKNLPVITFTFEGSRADMVIRAEGGFEVVKSLKFFKYVEYVCLAMMPTKMKSIIGAHQQTNQRIIYDTRERKLVFYSQDCSTNS